MKEFRFQNELELWTLHCDECGETKTAHEKFNQNICKKFTKKKLPTKKALKMAQDIIDNPTLEDVINIAKLIDRLKP